MQGKWRFIGLLTVLALAFALVPAVAMAAPAITQGIQGVVTDSVTGVPIPFAHVEIDVWGGVWVDTITAEYDGTYSYSLDADDYWVETSMNGYETSSTPAPVTVAANTVTTLDFSLDPDTVLPMMPVYRFFNMGGGVHFYTASPEEFISVYRDLDGIFKYDGVAYWIPVGVSSDDDWDNPNTLPLYRFFNRQTGVHFYTMSEEEKATVQNTLSDIYTYEGVAYYVTDGGGLPIFRFYNPLRNAHFYTADDSEILGQASQVSDFYNFEGIGFFIGDWTEVDGS